MPIYYTDVTLTMKDPEDLFSEYVVEKPHNPLYRSIDELLAGYPAIEVKKDNHNDETCTLVANKPDNLKVYFSAQDNYYFGVLAIDLDQKTGEKYINDPYWHTH